MRYYSAPRRALREVRQLLYPRRCPFCNAVLGSIRTCPDCAEEVDRLRRKPGIRLDASQHYLGGLSGAAAPFRYEGCVRRAILRAKYQAAPWTAVELGVVLAELAFGSEVRMRGAEPVPQRVEGARLGYDCIVPVPASSRRRGYNVPERMAQPLAEALDLPLETKALGPARRKDRQAGLPFEQRLANVAGAFRVQDPDLIEGRRVLLVDDVITTGATAAACAQAAAVAPVVITSSTSSTRRPSMRSGSCTRNAPATLARRCSKGSPACRSFRRAGPRAFVSSGRSSASASGCAMRSGTLYPRLRLDAGTGTMQS